MPTDNTVLGITARLWLLIRGASLLMAIGTAVVLMVDLPMTNSTHIPLASMSVN